MFFLLLFRKRENVKMAAACRRERQNGGLKGSEKTTKNSPKTVSKNTWLFDACWERKSYKKRPKILPKTIQKVDEKNAENSIEKWRPNQVAVDGNFDHGTSKIMPGWPHGLQRLPQGAQGPPRIEK